jgi:hypothetical protein
MLSKDPDAHDLFTNWHPEGHGELYTTV